MTAAIRSFFENYREDGYVGVDFGACSFIGQSSDFAIADRRWPIRRRAGNDSWRSRTGNNVRSDGGEWKILMVTAYEGKRLRNKEHAP